MNRRKKTTSIGLPTILLIVTALAIITGGGITYVVMKNQQITARAEIEKTHQRMAEHRTAISLYDTMIDEALGIFDLKERLQVMDSQLQEIGHGVVEVCLVPENPEENHQIAHQAYRPYQQ